MALRPRIRRALTWVAGTLASLVVLLILASFLADEPLRAYMERQLNAKVEGYSFRLAKLDFHPFGFSIDLEDLVVTQNSDPDPPVAKIGKWHASLEWTALLWGRLVNNQRIENPVLHITTNQVKKEAEDEVPVEDRGWQDAVEAIYPFKINEVVIVNGSISYEDEADPSRPIRIENVDLKASNIRNVRSKDREYPSEFNMEGRLFGKGKLRVDGHADFLAEPIPGVKADFHLDPTTIEDLLPLAGRINLQLRQGVLSAEGEVEYAPKVKIVQLKKIALDGVRIDYVHSARTQSAENTRAKKAYETGKELTNHEELVILVDQIHMANCEFGFVNQATAPHYRVYLTQTDMDLENFTNQLESGTSNLKLSGRFMGKGRTHVTGEFRPDSGSPNFDLAVKIEEAPMRSMNDLWRAYAKFDVSEGEFSLYSEMKIKNGAIRGYVKPLFKDVVVYDPRQDRQKSPLRKIYEGLIGDLAALLENAPRKEVATKADMSGKLDNPRTDTVETVLRLIQNAFFKAILPGLEYNMTGKQSK